MDDLDLGAILDEIGVNPETQHVEVILSQEEPTDSDLDKMTKFMEQQKDYSFVSSADIQMKLSLDDVVVADITEGFGRISLSLSAGQDYAGRGAIVYHIHDGDILQYKGLTVDADGYVHITVDKLSAFAVAVKKEKTGDDNTPDDGNWGSQIHQPNFPDSIAHTTKSIGSNIIAADESARPKSPKTGESGKEGWIYGILAELAVAICIQRAAKSRKRSR